MTKSFAQRLTMMSTCSGARWTAEDELDSPTYAYSNSTSNLMQVTVLQECRSSCGACCIAPSITTPFYGMPHGKAAGERCVHLDAEQRCVIFGLPTRPLFCSTLLPSREMCGTSMEEAMTYLTHLEVATLPTNNITSTPTS